MSKDTTSALQLFRQEFWGPSDAVSVLLGDRRRVELVVYTVWILWVSLDPIPNGAFMRLLGFLFLPLLLISTASAQKGKGWLGADVQDVTKAEADKLGWDTPHGAKVGVVSPGSPADMLGQKPATLLSLDGLRAGDERRSRSRS